MPIIKNHSSDHVPPIRFPEFTDEWEQMPINDMFELHLRPIDKPKANYKSIGIRSHFKGTFQRLDSDPSKNVMDTLFEVKENDLIVNITFAWEGAVAIAGKEDEGGLVSHRFPTYLNRRDKVEINFFRFLYPTTAFKRSLELISPGSAGRNRVLKKSDFLKLKFWLPSIPEQKRIAAFFTVLDKKIAQLKQKKALLEQYKKGVMQKLFSQELRFKSDDGNEFPKWEKKKLSDLVKIMYGKDQKQIADEDGKYPILGTGGIMGKTNKFLYDKPSVLIGRKGTIDKPVYMDTPFWTVDTLFYTEVLSNTIPKWLFYKFKTINWYLYNEASGVPSLSGSTIYQIKIELPSIAEQTKISNFLSAIDTKINRTENQIQQTVQYKQGLLQNMFV